jgi:sensor histidine kinase YesM
MFSKKSLLYHKKCLFTKSIMLEFSHIFKGDLRNLLADKFDYLFLKDFEIGVKLFILEDSPFYWCSFLIILFHIGVSRAFNLLSKIQNILNSIAFIIVGIVLFFLVLILLLFCLLFRPNLSELCFLHSKQAFRLSQLYLCDRPPKTLLIHLPFTAL